MVNFTSVNDLIVGAFGLISTLINEVVTLLTGDLFVLAVVGAIIALVIGLFTYFLSWIKGTMKSSTPNMRNK